MTVVFLKPKGAFIACVTSPLFKNGSKFLVIDWLRSIFKVFIVNVGSRFLDGHWLF